MAVEKENTSPAKTKTALSSVGRGGGGHTVAQVTMLDGSVLDVSVEVSDTEHWGGCAKGCVLKSLRCVQKGGEGGLFGVDVFWGVNVDILLLVQ